MRDEVPLSDEPPRLDYLLLRQRDAGRSLGQDASDPPGDAADGAATLRRLWPMLPRVSVVEYKSPSHPYRPGHLDRLWGYVHIHFANQRAVPGNRSGPTSGDRPRPTSDVRVRDDLSAVLVVANRTPSLDGDIASMGLSWEDCGGGYWRVRGGLFALFVVEIDVAGPSDGDDLLYSLGHGKPTTAMARRFWMELVGSKEAGMSMEEMEGYDELMQKFIDSLPPEQRLAGLLPEQRLAGLDHDHQALALPLDVLRLLPEEYMRSLSPEVAAELRRRLERNGH